MLLLASLIFLLFFSLQPLAWLPLACFLLFGFVGVQLLQHGRKNLFVPLLVLGIVLFVWLKKYTFVPGPLLLHFPYVALGLSYIFFRVLHLIIDANDDALPSRISFATYLNYTLNFTTLLSGPIQRYQDFAEMQLAPVPLRVDAIVAGRALERIIVGFFKVNVLSLALSTMQTQAIGNLTAAESLSNRILWTASLCAIYPLYLYCNFSGYIDMVIGIARFLRLELPENFNRPFASDNFLNFWSRWHITLSQWLKTYVYNPVLINLMRRNSTPSLEPFFGVFAFFVTFFLVGVWHGQTSEFLFFGLLQGGGVSAVKLYQILMAKRLGKKQYRKLSEGALYNACARGLTFAWFAFTLLWFWSSWHQLHQIASAAGTVALACAAVVIWLAATVVLAIWEQLRETLLGWQWNGVPVLTSRYTRTAWGTALAVIAIATLMLLNAPAPDIVYKAF